ncbi:MAG TPA: molecular chaperone DnaK [Planctomycetes bacterium]|nr:molecular chaperone DnaK [Planctomycetota bacterium]
MAAPRPRYIVGIDLGTTNCAVAYVDTAKESMPVAVFPIQQLVEPGVARSEPLLPSFLYLAAGPEIPAGGLDLPWARDRDFAVGALARILGGRAPGRLIASAKSWLCHGRVRRTQPILPWGAEDDVPKRSPVAAQAAYLGHIRDAWNHAMRHAPLEHQELVLTVPASFDEIARHLTLAAAKVAKLENVRLIEEPQAAFYAYLALHEDTWQEQLAPGESVLVCDVGGGTTDLSLIGVSQGRVGPVFTRRAVGDHILLGGDNMDLALARLCESGLGGGTLDMATFSALLAHARDAKERLLAADGPASLPVTVQGRGRSVVGGTRTITMRRDEVARFILERFFPAAGLDEDPEDAGNDAAEFGLPFARDEGVTRHIAAFLRRHAADESAAPRYVLLNGGVLVPEILQEAVVSAVGRITGRPAALLPADRPFLAVACGAAYFGRSRHGLGLSIRAGSPRAYYIGVATERGEKALCVMPRGAAEEGAGSYTSTETFHAAANSPVSFTVYGATARDDVPGDFIDPRELTALPPVRTILRYGRKGAGVQVPVTVRVELTEIGTLDLWCETAQAGHRWRLEFAVDAEGAGPAPRSAAPTETVPHEVIAQAGHALRACFGPQHALDPPAVVAELERCTALGRERWPLGLLRPLWDVLIALPEGRERSPAHEGRWLNLCGYLLRPGCGDPLDAWRVGRLWRLFVRGPQFPAKAESRIEWWILWRRAAGGLDEEKQQEVYAHLAARLLKGRGETPTAHETAEMWRAAAALELLPAQKREELGAALLGRIEGGAAQPGELFALARIGAREPLYAPVDTVVPPRTAAKWLARLLALKWPKGFAPEYALVHMARFTGDRGRDLPEDLREEIAARVSRAEGGAELADSLFRVTALSAQEEKKVFGDTLPLGLSVKGSFAAEA